MAEQFYIIPTSIGKAKIANSITLGTKLNLTTLKVGDSNGTYYNPSESQTDLVHTVYTCNVTSVEIDETNSNWINITCAIPSDVGDFYIREAGVFDDGGNLIAIGKYPETYKPVAADGATKELYVKMTFEVTNASNVTLKIDPTVILATKNDINILTNSIAQINSSLSDIPNQYVAKVTGKSLSTNDYDNTEKAEVAKLKNKAEIIDLNTQKARIDTLVATSSGSFYQKCLSTDTGALLVVASGATTGQINLASVTPLATGYTPVASDYVRFVYGVASGNAELMDARIGIDGITYANAGGAIRGQIGNINKNIYNSSYAIDVTEFISFEQGTIYTSTGANASNAYRVRTKNYFLIDDGDTIQSSANKHFSIILYDLNKNYIKGYDWATNYKHTSGTCYARIVIAYVTESNYVSVADMISDLSITAYPCLPTNQEVKKQNMISDLSFEIGHITDGVDTSSTTRVRSLGYFLLKKGDSIVSESDRNFLILYYDKTSKTYISRTNWIIGTYIHTDIEYLVRIVFAYTTESNFTTIKDLLSGYSINTNYIACDIDSVNDLIQKAISSNNNEITWGKGHLSTNTGEESSYNDNLEIRSNMFYAKQGTYIIPDVYGQCQVYFYDENKNFKGTASSLGYSQLGEGTNLFMPRANAFEIPISSNIRIVYCCAYNKSYVDEFGSMEYFISTLRIVPFDYSLQPYIKNAITKRFKEVCSDDKDSLNITFTTDVHEYPYHEKAAVYCANLTSQLLMNGGDLISIPRQNVEDTFIHLAPHIDELTKCKVPVVLTRGNHEISANSDYTVSSWYNQCQKPLKNRDMVYNKDDVKGGYFYIDNEDYKTRVVCVNIFRSNSGAHSIGETQMKWLCETAFNLSDKEYESDWKLLVLGHGHLLDNIDSSETVSTNEEKYLANVFKSIVEKTNVTNTYYSFGLNYSNVKYTFLAYFCGHVHNDDVRATSGFYHVVTTCDHPTSDSDGYERTFDSENEYAFDLMNFDYDNDMINCYRIGVGHDRFIHYKPFANASTLTASKLSGTTITWTSDNTNVATVSGGTITKVGNGIATIKATDETGMKEYFMIKMI